jgi:hypothetical protein
MTAGRVANLKLRAIESALQIDRAPNIALLMIEKLIPPKVINSSWVR